MKEYIRNVLDDMNQYLSPFQMKELQRSMMENAVRNENERRQLDLHESVIYMEYGTRNPKKNG